MSDDLVLNVPVERPWGSYEIVYHKVGGEVIKVLTINAGAILSLQSHALRAEEWRPMDHGILVYAEKGVYSTGTDCFWLNRGETYMVGRGLKHRLINPTERTLRVMETITGIYRESDIKRYHDVYGRDT